MQQLDYSLGSSGFTALYRNTAAALILCAPAVLCAQPYPAKTVTLVVPFAVGGAVDASARFVAEPMAKLLGQPIVVENRTGAAGNIGYGLVARAPKDGYTLLVSYSATTACSPALYSNLTWDAVKDFVPVGMMAVAPLVMAISASVPANSLATFVEYLKQNPGKVNYGTAGVGSLANIAAEMFQQRTGTKMIHVPYKGSSEMIPDLLAGRVQLGVLGSPPIKQHAATGKLKAIAVASLVRDSTMPEVPTANEAGVPGLEVEGWMGLLAPAGTPAQIITKLGDALQRATEQPEVRQRALAGSIEIRHLGPDATALRVRKDIQECGTTIRNAGIKLNNE